MFLNTLRERWGRADPTLPYGFLCKIPKNPPTTTTTKTQQFSRRGEDENRLDALRGECVQQKIWVLWVNS